METTQMTKVLKLVTEITDLSFKIEKSVTEEIRLSLAGQKADIDLNQPENQDYTGYEEELKNKLLIYFHLNNKFSRNKLVKLFRMKLSRFLGFTHQFNRSGSQIQQLWHFTY